MEHLFGEGGNPKAEGFDRDGVRIDDQVAIGLFETPCFLNKLDIYHFNVFSSYQLG